MNAGRKKEFVRDQKIVQAIREMVRAKVPVRFWLASLQDRFEGAPNNSTMLYRLYGDDIKAARASAFQGVGENIYNQALEGHFPSQELWLTTGEDWSKKSHLEVELGVDEESDVISDIINLLGVKRDETKDTRGDGERSEEAGPEET